MLEPRVNTNDINQQAYIKDMETIVSSDILCQIALRWMSQVLTKWVVDISSGR